jgi:hypothetical protein
MGTVLRLQTEAEVPFLALFTNTPFLKYLLFVNLVLYLEVKGISVKIKVTEKVRYGYENISHWSHW